MFNLKKIFSKTEKDSIAALLKVNQDALESFNKAYEKCALDSDISDNFFEINAKQAAEMHEGISVNSGLDEIIQRIVDELLNGTQVYEYNGQCGKFRTIEREIKNPVTNAEIQVIEETFRPQLTGTLMKVDINEPPYTMVMEMYGRYLKTGEKTYYNLFRQGLDILDVDSIIYDIIGMNPNSMGYWLPAMVEAVQRQSFFRIPKTTIIKVPLPMLQLTRIAYESLTRTTLDIVDAFCKEAFQLDEEKSYFIKTGTYSSKYDFRNAHVCGAKEVRELGEYLLFIHHQALQMASSLNNVCIYGVSTTNEWVVREYIEDKNEDPTIYDGLHLHTEYRVFVDMDTLEILCIHPYWDPDVMKKKFGNSSDPKSVHDYVIYKMHEDTIMNRYEKNKDLVKEQIRKLLPDINLSGQWCIDVMENGDDFWIIDMQLAINSAFHEYIPKGKLKIVEEKWIPEKLSLEE